MLSLQKILTEMKTLIIFVFLTILNSAVLAQQAETIKWHTFEEAMRLNASAPRKILIDVYTDWCGYCKTMDAQTFGNPVIARFINQNFYAIKFDAESTEPVDFAGHTFVNEGVRTGTRRPAHQLAAALGVSGYPTVVYFTADLKMIGPVAGFYTPEKMEPLLHYIAEGRYQSVSLEEFERTFVSRLSSR